jgi:hypothetical protein
VVDDHDQVLVVDALVLAAEVFYFLLVVVLLDLQLLLIYQLYV